MKIDLDGMSLKELKELSAKVQKAIVSFEERKKKEALAQIEEKARQLGFTLSELTGDVKPRRKRAAVAPKYANPKDPSNTWTGRGRRPRWVEEALQSGKTLDDLKI
ncbi:H-NS histone family protein [Ostreiculturibacter nitratireducens]|uniref:H-NS histone family protein n=1 Tax=Ostreiculturibacter nitratireducens TaxID=3075226 RepID=UPI0031B63FCE